LSKEGVVGTIRVIVYNVIEMVFVVHSAPNEKITGGESSGVTFLNIAQRFVFKEII
jgi:hypothetical protein